MFLDSLEWIEPAATALGLDKIRAISAGMRLDAPDAMLETTLALLAPEKGGLFGMIDGDAAPFEPPAVVGADASSVFTMRLNFDRAIPLARAVGATLPEPQRETMLAQVDAIEQQAGPILAALGSRLTVAKRIERPYGLESEKTLIIADVKDRQALTDAFGAMAPLVGAESRDFLGTQVWESAFMPEFAVSVTNAGLLMGDTPSVEGAIRESADAARPKLASEPRFVNAARALRPGIAHFYSDTRAGIEYSSWLIENMTWQRRLPDPEVMLRYFGDTAAELRSTPEGLVYRMLQLRPAAP
jgi:hypothetical protein